MKLDNKQLLTATWRTLLVAVIAVGASVCQAGTILPFDTSETSNWLIVGTGPVNDQDPQLGPTVGVGTGANTNNFEFGANKAPVPSSSDFLEGGGGGGGPQLFGAVRTLPSNAAPVFRGIGGHGNIAITSVDGTYNLQDVGVYADLGIHTTRSVGLYDDSAGTGSDQGTSNSAFYDTNPGATDFTQNKNNYPNTFDPAEWDAEGGHAGGAQSGDKVDFNDVDMSNHIDSATFAGVTGNVDHSALLEDLYDGTTGAKYVISGLTATDTLDVTSGIGSGGQGEIKDVDFTYNLTSGLNVVDIDTGGGVDFKLDYANLVIDGPADAQVVLRLPSDGNMLISNSNILIGDGGIGLEDVLFFTDKADSNQHFNFDNTILNGISFWSLGEMGGEIVITNSQGCVQLIADKVNLNDVRFNRCAFSAAEVEVSGPVPIPEASTFTLALMGMLMLSFHGRRRRRR